MSKICAPWVRASLVAGAFLVFTAAPAAADWASDAEAACQRVNPARHADTTNMVIPRPAKVKCVKNGEKPIFVNLPDGTGCTKPDGAEGIAKDGVCV
ncbi:hypothetical protein [Nocardia donostiensis]|nr:hypothetical protein [Nocardia donostiensis]